MAAVGITLMSGSNSGPVCSSDGRAAHLDQLQFTLGEGPCPDSFDQGVAIDEVELDATPNGRWPNFSPSAIEIGVRGVFAFPLLAGASRIGVMTLYHDLAGPLTEDQRLDAEVVADVLAQTLMTIQSRNGPGVLSAALTDHEAHRAEVHQASGMVAVQLGIPVDQALVRLRAHAFGNGRLLADVAQDVVARRLRLPDDRSTDGK